VGIGARARQWLLLCGLALAVVGMHHVPLAPHDTVVHSMAGETHAATLMAPATVAGPLEMFLSSDSGTGMGHDMPHLCVAVLCAAGGLVLLAWLLTVGTNDVPGRDHGLRPPVWQAWRLPRAAGRSLLTFVCVSRT
jgi:hypothetical protein